MAKYIVVSSRDKKLNDSVGITWKQVAEWPRKTKRNNNLNKYWDWGNAYAALVEGINVFSCKDESLAECLRISCINTLRQKEGTGVKRVVRRGSLVYVEVVSAVPIDVWADDGGRI